jgi:aspartate/methionine/tyrosine aminotransferase
MFNPLAQELNDAIQKNNVHVYEMLSSLGKALYFPKGILSQSAEAKQKAHRFNATIGIATEGEGPMYLDVIQKHLTSLNPQDVYTYAPPAGKMELRQAWRKKLLQDNPSLNGKEFGTPIVTSALTHGLSVVADLFVEEGDSLIVPDKFWGNYNLTFNVRHGNRTVTYPLFSEENTFNVKGMEEALLSCETGKAILLLNFPNNPTGYTPSEEEAAGIVAAIKKAADSGINVVVVADDAYFGLFYEESIKESIFARLIGLHPRVLPIKIDGATKEEYAWGFRVGFLTYGVEDKDVLEALEKKTMGAIRSAISSCAHLSQTLILQAISDPEFEAQRMEKYEIMKARANRVKEILDTGKYADAFDYYPFNSGYFMCLRLKNVDAETLRLHLLEQHGVGTISLGKTDLRVAFSCVEVEHLDELFALIYKACKELE